MRIIAFFMQYFFDFFIDLYFFKWLCVRYFNYIDMFVIFIYSLLYLSLSISYSLSLSHSHSFFLTFMSTLTTCIHVNPHYLHSCQPSLLAFMSTLTICLHANPHYLHSCQPSLLQTGVYRPDGSLAHECK